MILKALTEYYDRLAADPESGIPPLGWEWKRIPYVVIVDEYGELIDINDTRELLNKKLVAKSFLVPSLGESKGNGIKPNWFWENAEYFFGITKEEKKKSLKDQKELEKYEESVFKKHREFCQVIEKFLEILPNDKGMMGISKFLKKFNCSIDTERFADIFKDKTGLFIFKYLGDDLPIVYKTDIKRVVDRLKLNSDDGQIIRCLVTGEKDVLTRLEPPILGVNGTPKQGAHLVSVNNKISSGNNAGATPAFASYMKMQGANSPIGRKTSLAYAIALNKLLEWDSKQHIQVGDATTVFWAEKASPLENSFAMFFSEPPKDNPDALVSEVEALFRSVQTGAMTSGDSGTRFYVLGLSPNSARISIRFWKVGTVEEFSERFRKYFEDLRICHGKSEKEHLPLSRLLISMAAQEDEANINPHLSGVIMRAILEDLPFPETLLQSVLVRIKAERNVGYARAKLLKGYLIRKLKLTQDERNRLVSLDKENTNIGYRLGRLFAALEKIQQDALGDVNAGIRDRFYAGASSTPVTVFGNLIRTSNHWIAKVEGNKPGLAIVRKQLLAEILGGVDKFPAHLNAIDQGYFALGYYHQQRDFYTKKTEG